MFTIPEMYGENVQLDHHITPVELIVTPTARNYVCKLGPLSREDYRISSLLSKFFSILGTGFSSAIEIERRSTGQVCCRLSHSTIQSAQKACSHLDKIRLSDWPENKDFYSLWSQAGVLQHRAADRTDELLVHRAFKPVDVVTHPGVWWDGLWLS